MPQWKTAEQISALYVVGEERLIAYSRRGNLAMRRRPDGAVLFDEDGVARFFRTRIAAAAALSAPRANNLGVLGVARLGEAPQANATVAAAAPAPSPRADRRRALRRAAAQPITIPPLAATG